VEILRKIEHSVIIKLIVGLPQRVKLHDFNGNVKLTEGLPTTELYTKLD